MSGTAKTHRGHWKPPQRPNLRLMELRLQEGLSPNMLGYRAGVSGKTIRKAEQGVTPWEPTQRRIASVFGLSPLDLWPLEQQRKVAA